MLSAREDGPPGPLPFYLAIEPAPVGGEVAFAVARQVGDEVGVGVFVEDGGEAQEVFGFSRFAPALLAWSPCGDWLALAQGDIVLTRGRGGALALIALEEEAHALGLDTDCRLWILAGNQLEARIDGQIVAAWPGVCCATLGPTIAFCRPGADGIALYVVVDAEARLIGCVDGVADTVRLVMRDRHIALILLTDQTDHDLAARVLLFDTRGGAARVLLHRRLPAGFNGGPGLAVALSAAGETYAAFEDGACCRLWRLRADARPEPISPEGFEVFDFALAADGKRIAVIASDTRSPAGAFSRQLLIGIRIGDGWRFDPPVSGVYCMPRWRADGRLDHLCGADGEWRRRTADPGAPAPSLPAAPARALGSTGALDLMTLPGPGDLRSGVILLPRLHQLFVDGAQSFFFHQLLFWIARGLAAEGHLVVTPCGPGAIGRGSVRREVAGSYCEATAASVASIAETLRAQGCETVGLLAGSMAAVPGLRLLGPGSALAAGVFVAPLFEASIPVVAPLRRHLLDDPGIAPLEAAASALAVPMLVIHGGLDEVAPLSQVHRLARAADPARVETVIVEGEGHIFARPATWRLAAARAATFFATHLAATPGMLPERAGRTTGTPPDRRAGLVCNQQGRRP